MAPDTDVKVIEFRSEQSPTVIYACGLCGFTTKDEASAERCCLCARCKKPVEVRFGTMCTSCTAEDWRIKKERRRAKAMERPVVDTDGPVFVADNEHFYESADAAAEALYDDGIEPTLALAHPCHVGPVAMPDLHTFVDEAWGEEFEDGFYDGLPKAATEAIDECVKKLTPLAPTVWTPNERERVVLPAVTVSPEAIR